MTTPPWTLPPKLMSLGSARKRIASSRCCPPMAALQRACGDCKCACTWPCRRGMLLRPFQPETAMGRTIAGVVVGWLTIMLAEFASAPLHPMPAGFDMHDPASVAAFVATLPIAALLLV